MKLTIFSPIQQFERFVAWIEANTPNGNFIIQPQHCPTTLILSEKKDLIFRLKTGKQEVMFLEKGGILEITRTEARVFLPM